MNKKIATEERLLLMAQRRLESIRLLGELFNRLKVRVDVSLVPLDQQIIIQKRNY